MKNILCAIIIIIISILTPYKLFSQEVKNDTIYVAFWNQENLFDAVNDTEKDDEEFLPSGSKEWTQERLDKKLYNHARVIRYMNNNQGPDLLGVCEVEHQSLLDTLVNNYFPDKAYKVAYKESPDNRGIDNGLIYNSKKFSLLNIQTDTVSLSDGWPTRLILNVNLLTNFQDTLHVFVNHWPSRSGGEEKSQPNRIAAAEELKQAVNTDFEDNPHAKIIIIGDFNDEPTNNSILKTLEANPIKCDSSSVGEEENTGSKLYNLSYSAYERGEGSYKYRDDWNLLDQIIVSGNLIVDKNFHYICESYKILKPDFIVTHSGKYEGTPFPTYGGRRYLGGYSDHFPVSAKFIITGK